MCVCCNATTFHPVPGPALTQVSLWRALTQLLPKEHDHIRNAQLHVMKAVHLTAPTFLSALDRTTL